MFTSKKNGSSMTRQAPFADVLLAEDCQANILVLRLFFRDLPLELHVVHDGRTAVETFERLRPGLVLMDLDLPIMSGLAAARSIRETEVRMGLPPTPLVVLTAHDDPVNRAAVAGIGAFDMLIKPVRKAALLRCMTDCLPGLALVPTSFGGDSDMASREAVHPAIRDLIPLFLDIQTKKIREMHEALLSRDAERLRRLAHGLRGAAATYGFTHMSELAGGLESSAGAGRLDDSAKKLHVSTEHMQRIVGSEARNVRTDAS